MGLSALLEEGERKIILRKVIGMPKMKKNSALGSQ